MQKKIACHVMHSKKFAQNKSDVLTKLKQTSDKKAKKILGVRTFFSFSFSLFLFSSLSLSFSLSHSLTTSLISLWL